MSEYCETSFAPKSTKVMMLVAINKALRDPSRHWQAGMATMSLLPDSDGKQGTGKEGAPQAAVRPPTKSRRLILQVTNLSPSANGSDAERQYQRIKSTRESK